MKKYVRSERSRKRMKERIAEERDGKERGRDSTRLARAHPSEIAVLLSKTPVAFYENHGGVIPSDDYICWHPASDRFRNDMYSIHAVNLSKDEVVTPSFTRYLSFQVCAVALASVGAFAKTRTDEASHLCGDWRCIRPSHLVWEDHVQNMKRIGCPGTVKCVCCDAFQFLCKHEPKCIKIFK